MNQIIKTEAEITIFGVEARALNVVSDDTTGRIRNQTIRASRTIGTERLVVKLRFDDQCNNGHETFAITGDLYDMKSRSREPVACGCLHDDVAKFFPEFAGLIKWHLVSTDGPLHYVANTMYHADQHGPNKAWVYFTDNDTLGIQGGKERLLGYVGIEEALEAENAPGYRVEWDQKTAKVANFESARSCAVWPDATVEQLRSEIALKARLPALLADFKTDMLSCGFLWPEIEATQNNKV